MSFLFFLNVNPLALVTYGIFLSFEIGFVTSLKLLTIFQGHLCGSTHHIHSVSKTCLGILEDDIFYILNKNAFISTHFENSQILRGLWGCGKSLVKIIKLEIPDCYESFSYCLR